MKNYDNYQKFRNFLCREMEDFYDVEFDVHVAYDENKQKYLYVHLKDYSDGRQFRAARKKLCALLFKYDKVLIDCGSRKVLYWIPEKRGLHYLVMADDLFKIKPAEKIKKIKKTYYRQTPKLIRRIKLENTEYGHYKEWTGELYSNGKVITRWGRIGDSLTSKEFPKAGEEFLNKK